MSDPKGFPTDPFEAWRRIYAANEGVWTKATQDAMNTDAFTDASGKVLETFLGAQKTTRDAMTQHLRTLNLPTRDDVARLGETILALEEKIDQLDDRLAAMERGSGGDAPKAKPAGPKPAGPKAARSKAAGRK